ncbi:3'-5' exonuclease [Alkalimonas mucilaginosa]|uniref:3'-5' exonuclease n=1 Tax=Alkalimonas mucilaginosa TaxID=3057676 RepID=A0ABU7JBK4_9GAMM|nr:3'-5' exonuclease [Alkalimonas sp. MEB004]MEE2023069.1 3'-5' exonuclease [Alkalimonas sp. MEB004]
MLYLGPAKQKQRRLPGDPAVADWPQHFANRAKQSRHWALQQYYQAGIPAADSILSEVPLLAMDFETTGFDAKRDGILSIGTVPMSLGRIHSSQARHWLLKPKFALTEQSVVVHGITHSAIESAPDITEILPELLQQMAGKVVVVHFRGIERPFLAATLQDRLGEGIDFPVIDTMELEARLHRARPPSLLDKLLGRQPVSIRLADSRRRYGLPDYRPHHALTDALACAELLQAQIADRFSPDTPLSELWR